jgi:DNA-binding IclR family transcriptional regulator
MMNQGSTEANKPRSGLNTGLDVLELLARDGGPSSLTAIARELGMSKSGVHSALATLHRRGFVERGGEGEYRLGLRAWELGSGAPPAEIVRRAAPHMEWLAREVQEGVILGMLEGFDVAYIHLVDSPQPVRVHTGVGDRIRAHCTSTGLALLAALPEAELKARLPARLARITPETITNREELLRELQRVRLRGYAVNRGGWQEEVGGTAAVLPGGDARAALCVAAPRYRVTRAWLAKICPPMLEACRRAGAEPALRPAPR